MNAITEKKYMFNIGNNKCPQNSLLPNNVELQLKSCAEIWTPTVAIGHDLLVLA